MHLAKKVVHAALTAMEKVRVVIYAKGTLHMTVALVLFTRQVAITKIRWQSLLISLHVRVAWKCCDFHSHLPPCHWPLEKPSTYKSDCFPINSDTYSPIIAWLWFVLTEYGFEDLGLNCLAYISLDQLFGRIQWTADAALFIALLMKLFTCVIKLPVQ